MSEHFLDPNQRASALQFDRQSDQYGKSHILADTQDVARALEGLSTRVGGRALDVATGGGHTALWLAGLIWNDILTRRRQLLKIGRKFSNPSGPLPVMSVWLCGWAMRAGRLSGGGPG